MKLSLFLEKKINFFQIYVPKNKCRDNHQNKNNKQH